MPDDDVDVFGARAPANTKSSEIPANANAETWILFERENVFQKIAEAGHASMPSLSCFAVLLTQIFILICKYLFN